MKFLYAVVFWAFTTQVLAQNRIYVNHLATGSETGQSWLDAYSDLGVALQTAATGDSIWVAQGTYRPTSDANRDTSFYLDSGVRMYGGFSGNETSLQQRNWESHQTILSGDIGMPDDSTDNSYTILYMDNPDSLTVLDGFVFRYGNAGYPLGDHPPDSPYRSGGALYILADWEAFALIEHCRFEHNSAQSHGGAVYVNGVGSYAAAPTFRNCIFEHNTAGRDGGALARVGNSDIERVDFEKCVFNANHAGRFGGGLYYLDGDANSWIDLKDCSFADNGAQNIGAAATLVIGNQIGSKVAISGCQFLEQSFPLNTETLAFWPRGFSNCKEIVITYCYFKGIDRNSKILFNVLGLPEISSCRITHCRFEGPHTLNRYFIEGEIIHNVVFSQDTILNMPFSGFYHLNSTKTIFADSFFKNIGLLGAFNGDSVLMSNLVVAELINNATGLIGTGNGCYPSIVNSSFIDCTVDQLYVSGGAVNRLLVDNCLFSNSIFKFSNIINQGQFETILTHCAFDTDSICKVIDPGGTVVVTCGPNNLFGLDPLFRDTANGDYSLLPCSPLLDMGSNAAAAGLLTDISGAPRIQGGTVDIGAYEAPAFALSAAPGILPACSGAPGGAISLSPAYGCEPYTYTWQPPVGSGPTINDLPPGEYRYTVTDDRGRQIQDTLQVTIAPSPSITTLTQGFQCGSILGGTATVTVSSGTAPFTFVWSNGASDSLLTMLPAGPYQVTVIDQNGCQDSAQLIIALNGLLTLQVDGVSISCFGAADAMLSVRVVNGKSPYTYLWSQGATDSLLTDLGPGQYTVTATDFYGCTASFTFTLSEPTLLQASVQAQSTSTLQNPNGAASALPVSGGSQPYTYLWSYGGQTQTINNLAPGIYTVTVTDTHGCTASASAEVTLVVGTGEVENPLVQVWPNPMLDRLEIQALSLPPGDWRFVLRDVLGRELRGEMLLAGRAVLDVADMPAGGYSWGLVGRSGEVLVVGKVVK